MEITYIFLSRILVSGIKFASGLLDFGGLSPSLCDPLMDLTKYEVSITKTPQNKWTNIDAVPATRVSHPGPAFIQTSSEILTTYIQLWKSIE